MKKETIIEIIIIIVLAIILGILLFNYSGSNKNSEFTKMEKPGEMNQNSNSAESTGAIEVTDEQALDGNYKTSNIDESVIKVTDGGILTLNGATVSKEGGDSSNTENSEFYGVNAGILTTEGTTTIKNSTITTNAKGANAVFATGENSKVYVYDTTITTTGESSSRGLDSTYGGYIEADNVTITTNGGSCATLATDRGEGTVIAKNSQLETNGVGSPIIYSTGDISISNTKGTANNSQNIVIEGKNSATVENSTLYASGKGNRGDVDVCGVMIYQSMSGDASQGTGTLTAIDSTLGILENSSYYKTAPMFLVTNTDAVINLTNTKLSFGSNILLSSKGTSEWGNSNSNGGNVTINANNQELNGNIEIDNISTLEMNLTKSNYKGTINSENSAKEINLKIDSSSKITLTDDSYINSLEDEDSSYSNIDFNGFKLYVNGIAIN